MSSDSLTRGDLEALAAMFNVETEGRSDRDIAMSLIITLRVECTLSL